MSIIETPGASAPGTHEPLTTDPAIPLIIAGLQTRYPEVEPAVVRRCVEDAANGFEDARIRTFLPTLIERTAAEALRSSS